MASEYEKMIAGDYYRPADPELRALAKASREKQEAFNQEVDPKKGASIIKEWFGSTGENLYLNRQVLVDYGGNIHLGENFYANYNLTMLDVCPITIGKNAMIGPNCQFLTPLHPLDPDERNSGLEYGAPITIGDDFWAGGGVTILPVVSRWVTMWSLAQEQWSQNPLETMWSLQEIQPVSSKKYPSKRRNDDP